MAEQTLLDDIAVLESVDISESYRQYGMELVASFRKIAAQIVRNCNNGKHTKTEAQAIKFPPSVTEKVSTKLTKARALSEPPSVSPIRGNIPLANMTSSPTSSLTRGRQPRRAKQRIHGYNLLGINAKVRRPTNVSIHSTVTTLVNISEENSSTSDVSRRDVFKKPILPPKRAKANVPSSQPKMDETVSASTTPSWASADDKSLPDLTVNSKGFQKDEDPSVEGDKPCQVDEPRETKNDSELPTEIEELDAESEPSPDKTQVVPASTTASKARGSTTKKLKTNTIASVTVCLQEKDVSSDQQLMVVDSTQPCETGNRGSEPDIVLDAEAGPSKPHRSSRSAPGILSEAHSAESKMTDEIEEQAQKPSKPVKRSSSSDPPPVDVASTFGRATRSKMRKIELEKESRAKSCESSSGSSDSNKENPAAAILKDFMKTNTKPRTPMKTPNLLSPLARNVGNVKNTNTAVGSSVKEQEAAKKKEELMKKKADELRKQRELKTKKVHELKAAAEFNRQLLEKEKKEKEKKERELKAQLLKEKEEKRNEKKLLLLQKAKEAEERRQKEEQMRLAKLKEAEEEKKRAEEEKVRQVEEAERLAALRKAQAKEESARLLKEQPKKIVIKEAANITLTEDNIGIHDNDQVEADERTGPPRIARWARNVEDVLEVQAFQISPEVSMKYFGPSRTTPDLAAMFGPGLRYRPRTSSANWDPPTPTKRREDLDHIPE